YSTGARTLHLYIDGAEEPPSPLVCPSGNLTLNNAPIEIGGSYGQPTRDGEIYVDDVRLYNRAVSPAEIDEVRAQPIAADLTGDSKIDIDDFRVLAANWMETDYTIQSDTGKMVAHWDFEGPAGSTNIADSITGTPATIVGTASLDGSGAIELPGGRDGAYVDLGANIGNVIAGLDEYTVLIDCDWDGNSVGSWQRLASFGQEGTAEFAMFTYVSINEKYMRWNYRHDGHDETTNASSAMPDMKGRHQIGITFTRDYDNYGCTQFYIDGKQKAFHTQTVAAGSIGATTRNYLGKGPYTYVPGDTTTDPNIDVRFGGKIYDVRIYERRLAAQDVNDVYNGWSTTLYFPLEAPANWSDNEPVNSKIVDF
ncbi:MAG: LamG-like jellyroll fold domain-containing protein, partial [Phycisphaerales bacterium]